MLDPLRTGLKLRNIVEMAKQGDKDSIRFLRQFINKLGVDCEVDIPNEWSDDEVIRCAEATLKNYLERTTTIAGTN